MKNKNGVLILLWACFSSLLCALPCRSTAAEGRVLGGYRFIPSSTVEDPFLTTHFRNATGLSFTSNVEIPFVVIDTTPPDTILSLNGNLLFVVVDFEYQQRIHPRVVVRFSGSGASRVGTSGESLISTGVTALFGGGLGTTVSLWSNDRVLLSGTADLSVGHSLVIDMLQYAKDIVEGRTKEASVLAQDTGGGGDVGIRVAWAASRWAGLTGLGQVGVSTLEGRDSDVLWRMAGSGSIDFGQRDQAPVGLLLSVDIDRLKPQSLNANTATSIGLGVFYTGREDFNIGLEGRWIHLPLSNRDLSVSPVSFTLALRYFF